MIALLTGAFLGAQFARNPIVWSDIPDISIVRVGSDYYMSSTTMHMSPGLPIMKSKDLVHWSLASYAYNILGENDALSLLNGKNAYGKGSWASCLRYHGGKFYASTFSSTTGKTHVYSTEHPDRTPWSEVSFSPSLHDHSLFFDDDGKVYMAYGAGDIRLVELKSDLSGIKEGGFHDVIIRNASKVAGDEVGLPAEGTQLFKVNGRYYLCNIAWPRGGMRTQIVHRADNIKGPYEGRIMFRDGGIAQGGIVDTPRGDWVCYLFQDNGAVGRIPYILPMRWEDGWPIVGDNGKLPKQVTARPTFAPPQGIVGSDEFEQDRLGLIWQWNHNPIESLWSLNERPGWLRLKTGRLESTVTQAPNTLTQRTFGPGCVGTTLLDVGNMKDGDCAGLIALMNRYAYVAVVMDRGEKTLVMALKDGTTEVKTERIPLGTSRVYLRMEADFRDQRDIVTFLYSYDGQSWNRIGRTHRLHYDLVHFMGCRFGLFNFATKSSGGSVDFDFFRVNALSDPSTQ